MTGKFSVWQHERRGDKMKRIKNICMFALAILMIGLFIPSEAIFASDGTKSTIQVKDQSGKAGETVNVDIVLSSNPGIAGATLQVEYSEKLTLQSIKNGEALSELTFTQPAVFDNPSRFLWDSERGMSKQDGTLLTLQFLVSEQAVSGEKLPVHISYVAGDIFNENLKDVEVQLVDGFVIIPDEKSDDCSVTGHKYGTTLQKIEGSEVIPAENECLKQGSYEVAFFCERCGEYDPDSVQIIYTDAKGHVPQEIPVTEDEVKATHKTEGSYNLVVRCKNCGEIISSTKVITDKIPHEPGEPVRENEVAATHKQKGSYDLVIYCSDENCKEELSRNTVIVDKEEHVPAEAVKENVTEATCEKEGSYVSVIKCSVCNEVLSKTSVTMAKKNHVPGKAVEENLIKATCTKAGSYDSVVYCETCKKEISREHVTIDKRVHTYVIDKAVAPTYSKKGKTEGAHCSQCKTVLVAQKTIPKLEKKNATIKVKKKTFTYKASKVKKANQTFNIGATVTGNGKITYTKISGSSRLKVTKAGKVTVRKGTKKGTYRLTVNIKAASSKKYKAKTKKFTITVKIR